MQIIKSGQYYGKLTDRTYDSIEAMLFYEKQEAMRRDVLSAEEEAVMNLPLDKLRSVVDKLAQSEQERPDRAQCSVAMETWVELHPEFDNTEHPDNFNGRLMAQDLRSHGIKWPTLTDFEDAYDRLRPSGLLRLKTGVLRQQEKSKIKQLAADIEAQGGIRSSGAPSEEELQNMPLEEIRRRASLGHLPAPRGPHKVSANFGR